MGLKEKIKANPSLFKIAHAVHAPFVYLQTAWRRRPIYKRELATSLNQMKTLTHLKRTIWFCGVPTHNNLGDQAQAQCIRNWLAENYGNDYQVTELLAFPFYSKRFKSELDRLVSGEDLFVIQSGYCTSENHYNHYMHRYIVSHFENPVLIMPQTVNFYKESEGYKTGRIYQKHKKLLFLARDKKSFEYASKYFKETKILLYPDIVTSLIGTKTFNEKRDGVLLCVRNDGEKLYTSEDISHLKDMFAAKGIHVEVTDTDYLDKDMSDGIVSLINKKIEQFAMYQVIITDRYHGTIFSMIANTPVVVLATNDHKVKTGTEWFKGVYDGAFSNANSIDDAYQIAMQYMADKPDVSNSAYFKEHYYDKLYQEFLSICQ